jgi:hypothetical protein
MWSGELLAALNSGLQQNIAEQMSYYFVNKGVAPLAVLA